MKMQPFAASLALAGWTVSTPCLASAVGTSLIEQPVNLGPRSDPAKIPLGRTPVMTNYYYGKHRIIGEARPCPDGSMRWEGGSELDQNLASVFGISVEPEDSTQVPGMPVTLRLKPWKPPAYSPYTKEQVLAATLWCLVRTAGGTPEAPLEVLVLAEGPEDKPLEAKYSGEYVTRSEKEGEVIPPPKIPGTVVEEDARGIAWVSFPDVPRKDTPPSPAPAMIITESGGDGQAGWHLVPVWTSGRSDKESPNLAASSISMCQVVYPFRGTAEANAFVAAGGMDSIKNGYKVGDEKPSVEFSYPRMKPEILAAEIYAMVITTLPTEEEPLKVSIRHREGDPSGFSHFIQSPGWKETQIGNGEFDTVIECEFVWNPETETLTKGSIPLVEMGSMSWIEEKEESDAAPDQTGVKLPEPPSPSATTPESEAGTLPAAEMKPVVPPAPEKEEETPAAE